MDLSAHIAGAPQGDQAVTQLAKIGFWNNSTVNNALSEGASAAYPAALARLEISRGQDPTNVVAASDEKTPAAALQQRRVFAGPEPILTVRLAQRPLPHSSVPMPVLLVMIMISVMVASVTPIVIVTMTMVAIAIAVLVSRHVFVVVPIVSYKVDPLAAGVVLSAMLRPMLFVAGWYMQVDRRG